MALVAESWENVLAEKLKVLFTERLPSKGSDWDRDNKEIRAEAEWFAERLAEAIASTGTDQIKTAGIPIGSVVIAVGGAGAVGTPNPVEINVI